MRKRNVMALLLAMMLTIGMMLTGCGGSTGDSGDSENSSSEAGDSEEAKNEFVGVWSAKYDMKEEIAATLKGYEDCFQKELNIVFVLEFDEENVKFHVDENCMVEFIANYKESMRAMLLKVLDETAATSGIKVDDLLAAMQTDVETYIADSLAAVDFDAMADTIIAGFGDAISTQYEYDEDTITLIYEDNQIEEWSYKVEGESIVINITDELVLTFTKE